MSTIAKTLALLLLLVISTPALAASPLVCKPYASDVARTLQTYVWMRAYASCLSSDGKPVFADRTNVRAALCLVLGGCDDPVEGSVPATGAPADAPVAEALVKPIQSNRVKTVRVKATPAQICADAGKKLVKRKHGWRCR